MSVGYTSDDWYYIKSQLEKQLSNARDMLENKSTNPEDTAFYRGRVALAKEILNLPEIGKLLPLTGD